MCIEKSNTFIEMKPCYTSKNNIVEFYETIGLENVYHRNRLHVTIIDFWEEVSIPDDYFKGRITISHETYFHKFIKEKDNDLFTLILCFKNEEVEKLHNKIREEFNIQHKHNIFTPHITIANSIEKSELEKIFLPRFDITLNKFFGHINMTEINDMFKL